MPNFTITVSEATAAEIASLLDCTMSQFICEDKQCLDIVEGCPHDVMVKATACGIVVSEFVFQSRYYVHFRANTLGKGMNPLILPAMG